MVFGSAGLGSSGSLALSSLNGTSGFGLIGQAGDNSGNSVASAGDVNGDGIADLVIGAPNANSFAGKSYVVFGRVGLGGNGSLALSSLNGTNGFVVNGKNADDFSGNSVASAGDVNADGIADLVIGAYGANTDTGKSYVVFGRKELTSSNVPLIAGIAGGAGALTLSIIAVVVAFLRKRSKNKNKNLEGAIPLPKLQVNKRTKGETANRLANFTRDLDKSIRPATIQPASIRKRAITKIRISGQRSSKTILLRQTTSA